MKKETNNKIKLGVFVSIGIAILIIGIYLIGQRQLMFSNTITISGIFKDINGLQVGNNVRFSGINVSTVDNINIITDSTVQVDMVIDKKTQKYIKKDASAVIGSDGLMGNKILIISPGKKSSEMVKDNGFIGTIKPVSIDDILISLKVTTDNAAVITSDLSTIMTNIREGKGTIGKLFMDTVFAENIDKTLVSVKKSASGLNTTIDAAQNSFLLKRFMKKKKEKKPKDK